MSYQVSIEEYNGPLEAIQAAKVVAIALNRAFVPVNLPNGIHQKVYPDSRPLDVYEMYRLKSSMLILENEVRELKTQIEKLKDLT